VTALLKRRESERVEIRAEDLLSCAGIPGKKAGAFLHLIVSRKPNNSVSAFVVFWLNI
jgi:hypothetical protein